MADVVLLQDKWALGMKRDMGRHQIPKGSAWNMVDVIPNLGGPARKRGGYTYADTAAMASPATYVSGIKQCPFVISTVLTPTLVAVDEDGDIHSQLGGTTWTDRGAAVTVVQNPVFFENIAIIPAGNGTALAKSYTGAGVIADLSSAGEDAIGKFAAVYKNRLLLANSAANPSRILFSPTNAPTDPWDVLSYQDASMPVTGLGVLRQALLVFSEDRVERIRGSNPATTDGDAGDLVLEYFSDEGCIDARSIVNFGDDIIYANTSGVWQTDGAITDNLAARGGIDQYWKSIMASYSNANYTIAAGLYRSHYIVCVMGGTLGDTFVDCLACDIQKRVWFRLGNMKFSAIERSTIGLEELYMGSRAQARVNKGSSMWSPAAANKFDADSGSTAVAPIIETPYYRDKPGFKRWDELYLGYDIRDAASDNPTLRIAYTDSPEDTSYTDLTGGSKRADLPETSAYARARIPVRRKSDGLAFRITQQNNSSDTYFYDVEAEVRNQEKSKT